MEVGLEKGIHCSRWKYYIGSFTTMTIMTGSRPRCVWSGTRLKIHWLPMQTWQGGKGKDTAAEAPPALVPACPGFNFWLDKNRYKKGVHFSNINSTGCFQVLDLLYNETFLFLGDSTFVSLIRRLGVPGYPFLHSGYYPVLTEALQPLG